MFIHYIILFFALLSLFSWFKNINMKKWEKKEQRLIRHFTIFCKDYKIPDHHGLNHGLDAIRLCHKALKFQILPLHVKRSALIASLLHDVDDRKLNVPRSHDPYMNAKLIMNNAGVDEYKSLVLEMISLVSCSKNKNFIPKLKYLLIPREVDRCLALGEIGIQRCLDYTYDQGKPLYTNNTPLPTTEDEFIEVCRKYSLDQYKGESESALDHFYDKLIHLKTCHSGNSFLKAKLNEEHEIMVRFLMYFGRVTTITRKFD